VPIGCSLATIGVLLAGSMVVSVLLSKREQRAQPPVEPVREPEQVPHNENPMHGF
jgi:hypothetical protein